MYYASGDSSDGSVSAVVLCVVIIFIFVILFRGVSAQRQCSGPAVVYTTAAQSSDGVDDGAAVLVPNVGYAEKSHASGEEETILPYNTAG